MKSLHVLSATMAIGLFLGVATSAGAQTPGTAPTSQFAPGPHAPPYSMGAIGPGNVPIAPGAGVPGTERIGPGGTLIAPGPAGTVSGSPPMSTPAMPTTRVK